MFQNFIVLSSLTVKKMSCLNKTKALADLLCPENTFKQVKFFNDHFLTVLSSLELKRVSKSSKSIKNLTNKVCPLSLFLVNPKFKSKI